MKATVTQCAIPVDRRSMRIFDGRPVLEWLLREFQRFGVTDFLLLGGADDVDPEPLVLPRPARIALSRTQDGAGSGGALLQVQDQLQDRFLLCDGNTLFDWNLGKLLAQQVADGPEAAGRWVWLDPAESGFVAILRRSALDRLRPGGSLEAELLGGGRMQVRTAAGGACGPRVLAAADSNVLRRKALFLDRDGVINIDHGHVGTRDRFDWTEGALDAVRYAADRGWHVFVVTNQSGVARGLYTEDAVRDLLDWIGDQVRNAGGTIDDVRYCPFHPEATVEPYRQQHPWRKPMPGMLLDLIGAWGIDPARAVMIGDQQTDMQAADAAGVAGHLFGGGNLLTFLRPILDRH